MLNVTGIEKDASSLGQSAGVLSHSDTSKEVSGGRLYDSIKASNWGRVIQDAGSLLVGTTDNVSVLRHYAKYGLLHSVRHVLRGMNMRVDYCLRASKETVKLQAAKDGHFHAHGVWVCGSVWTCPVCSKRIAEERREVIFKAVQESGLFPVMVTLTLQHGLRDELKDLIRMVKAAWREVKSGRGWKAIKARYGIAHYMTSLEIRYSLGMGWHPHLHVLILCKNEIDTASFKREITDVYTRKIAKNGGYASQYHSIEVTAGDAGLASYCSKWDYAAELLRGGSKAGKDAGSMSVWDLAAMGGEGDEQAAMRFREYARATYGKKQLTFSVGAERALNISKELKEDKPEELKEEDVSEVIIEIPRKTWGVIHRLGLIGQVLYLAEVRGAEAVRVYLDGLPAPG